MPNAKDVYDATHTRTDGGIRAQRHLVISHDVFAARDYPEVETLIYAALQDSRATLTLSRPEAVAGIP